MGRKQKEEYAKVVPGLPEGWEIMEMSDGGKYAIVKIRTDDLTRVRLMKLPKEVRDYFRKTQRRYRQRVKEKKSARKEG